MRVALVLLVVCACGSKPSGDGDAGTDTDAPADADDSPCQGQCKQTNVTLMFNVTRTIDTAYYGTTFDSMGLHVEGYYNAAPGCPTGTSPTPDYTLVMREVSPTTPTSPMATANVLDFKGDLLGGPLGLAATMKEINTVAWRDKAFIALDVNLTFSTGTAVGHVYATHCSTLDN